MLLGKLYSYTHTTQMYTDAASNQTSQFGLNSILKWIINDVLNYLVLQITGNVLFEEEGSCYYIEFRNLLTSHKALQPNRNSLLTLSSSSVQNTYNKLK